MVTACTEWLKNTGEKACNTVVGTLLSKLTVPWNTLSSLGHKKVMSFKGSQFSFKDRKIMKLPFSDKFIKAVI